MAFPLQYCELNYTLTVIRHVLNFVYGVPFLNGFSWIRSDPRAVEKGFYPTFRTLEPHG